jgi:hypothetical protein
MGTILSLDLGKFKTVACWYDVGSGAARFQTTLSNRAELRDRPFRNAGFGKGTSSLEPVEAYLLRRRFMSILSAPANRGQCQTVHQVTELYLAQARRDLSARSYETVSCILRRFDTSCGPLSLAECRAFDLQCWLNEHTEYRSEWYLRCVVSTTTGGRNCSGTSCRWCSLAWGSAWYNLKSRASRPPAHQVREPRTAIDPKG